MKEFTYVQYEPTRHRIAEGMAQMNALSREKWVRVATVYCDIDRVIHHVFERDIPSSDPYRGG